MSLFKTLPAIGLLLLASIVSAQELAPSGSAEPDPVLAAALDEQGLIYSINSEGNFMVEYQMDADEERSQRVFVVSRPVVYRDAELREIWSVAVVLNDYPDAELMFDLLAVNSGIKVGAWAVEEFENEIWILYTIKVPIETGSATLKDLVYFVAEMCDELEKDLVGDDIY